MLQNNNVKLCLGGHKHSYTCTYPIYESPEEIKNLVNNIDIIKDYDLSKLFITISNKVGTNKIVDDEENSIYSYQNNIAYPFLRASESSKYNEKAVTYFMV
jgi:hypothetical protein